MTPPADLVKDIRGLHNGTHFSLYMTDGYMAIDYHHVPCGADGIIVSRLLLIPSDRLESGGPWHDVLGAIRRQYAILQRLGKP